MNKIVIVGHPSSGIEDVEKILVDSGMSLAESSLHDGLTPREIDATICKAYGGVTLNDASLRASTPFKQINVSSIWNGLALDLMRGNLEQTFWGWSDPLAIFLLDFWRNVDSEITFILVYNHPASVLKSNLYSDDGNETPSSDSIGHPGFWKPYNEALLHFYQRNSECCILVHGEQLQHVDGKLIKDVAKLPQSDLVAQLNAAPRSASQLPVQASNESDNETPDTALATVPEFEDVGLAGLKRKSTPLVSYLAETVVNTFSDELELYEELQAVATIPSQTRSSAKVDSLEAWKALCLLVKNHHEALAQANDALAQTSHLQAEKGQYLLEQKALSREHEILRQKIQNFRQELQKWSRINQEVEKKKKWALEKMYSQKDELQELSKKLEDATKQHQVAQLAAKEAVEFADKKATETALYAKQLDEKNTQLQIAQREKNRLAALAEEKTSEISWHLMQLNEKKTQLQILQEAAKEAEAHANETAEKAEQRLRQIESLQFELNSISKQILVLRSQNQEKAQQSSGKIASLLQEKHTLIQQLGKFSEELTAAREENKQLAANQRPVYLGAEARAQKELPYRVGSAIIEYRLSVVWLLLFPWVLSALVRRVRIEHQNEAPDLPRLVDYQDKDEAKKVEKHLSFLLGNACLTHIDRPWSWIVMPWVLLAANGKYRRFRREKVK